jgi:hypothetical protein
MTTGTPGTRTIWLSEPDGTNIGKVGGKGPTSAALPTPEFRCHRGSWCTPAPTWRTSSRSTTRSSWRLAGSAQGLLRLSEDCSVGLDDEVVAACAPDVAPGVWRYPQ